MSEAERDKGDPRWALLADLAQRAGQPEDEYDKSPVLRNRPIRIHRVHRLVDAGPARAAAALPRAVSIGQNGRAPQIWRDVVLRFDARMPFKAVIAEFRELWKQWADAGVVSPRNRALGKRKVELLRFVCLEFADVAWPQLYKDWNRRHRKWGYPTFEAFVTSCHDAEEQLTGDRHGLRWFYNPIARVTDRQLARLIEAGDADARTERDARRRDFRRAAEAVGFTVEIEQGGKKNAQTRTR